MHTCNPRQDQKNFHALMQELMHLDKSKFRGNRNKSFCKWENGLEHTVDPDGTSESAIQQPGKGSK